MPAEIESGYYVEARGLPWHVKAAREVGAQEMMTGGESLITAEQLFEIVPEIAFEVAKTPVQAVLPDGSISDYPERQATVRLDTGAVLGIVGDGYRVMQNRDAAAFGEMLQDSGDALLETAGSLFGGRRVFFSFEIGEGIEIAGDPGKTRSFLLVTNGHDGMTPFGASVVSIRTVCWNTWQLALAGARASWKIRHTASLDGRVAEARKALGLSFTYMERYKETAEALILKTVTDRQIENILRKAFPVPETQDTPERIEQSTFSKVLTAYRTSPTVEPVRGTAYGVLQAVGEYLDFGIQYHGRRFADDEVRMDNLVYGGSSSLKKQQVLNLLADRDFARTR